MKKLLFFLFFVSLFFCSYAEKLEEERPVDFNEVMNYLQKCDKMIKGGDQNGQPIASIKYTAFRVHVGYWLKKRWLELDTQVSREWFIKIYKLIDYMAKAKRYIDAQKFNARTKSQNYQKAVQNFVWAYKKFAELLKNPEKVDPKMLRKLKKQKKEWMKKARAKMEKTGSRR
jgi:hypothetical protein